MKGNPRTLRVRGGALEIEWADGTSDALAHTLLRQRCPCAGCRQQQRQSGVPAGDPSIAVVDARPYGPNALHLTFSDGHGQGIFPFAYLAELARERAGFAPIG